MRQWFDSIYALPRDVDVMDCFDRPVKTSCGFVNMARKAEISQWKLFFQSKLCLSRFRADLNSSLARSAGGCWPNRRGGFSTTDWGLWVLKFSPIFGVSPSFRLQICYKVIQGLKRRGFWPSFQKNLEPKEWPNGLGRRAGQKWLKKAKTPPLVAVPPENPKPKTKKIFFQFRQEDLLNP